MIDDRRLKIFSSECNCYKIETSPCNALQECAKEISDLKNKLHRRNKTTDNLRAEIKQLKSEIEELHCFCQNDLCEQCTTEYLNTQQINR